MAGPIKALLVLEDVSDRRLIDAELPSGAGVETAGIVEGLHQVQPHLDTPSDVVIVVSGRQSEEALDVVAAAARHTPQRPVVLMSAGAANGYVRRAFQAGAEDMIVLTPTDDGLVPSDDLVFAVQKAVARRSAPPEGSAEKGRLICVLGPKGGIGKTLTSCNLSVALAERGSRVVLVDLDLQFGDLGLSLGLAPERTSYDLAVAGGTLDADKVEAYLSPHSSGVQVLLAPSRPDQAGMVTVDFLQTLYAVLRASFDYVIVDTPPGFTPEVITTIDASTHISMVGMLDTLSLKNTKLGLETLELMGYDMDRVRLVLNRADSNVGITHNDVVRILTRPPDVLVPSHRDITRSVNDGTPIVMANKRSEAAKAFRSLADIYAALPARRKSDRRGGRLTRSKG